MVQETKETHQLGWHLNFHDFRDFRDFREAHDIYLI